MLQKYILFLKKHPLITATIAVAYAMLCIFTVRTETNFQAFIVRTMLCGAVCFFLYQISGDKTLTAAYNDTWYVIKVGIGFWIMALPLCIIGLLGSLAQFPLRDNIPVYTLVTFLMFVFVGLFEELTFRAVINDAIIYAFRDKKFVFVASAIVSSVVFGAAHVIGAELTDVWAVGSAAGKIIQTAVFGLALLMLYWKTRNIWACGVVHGIYDFIISVSSCIFDTSSVHPSYVVSGETGMAVIVVYIVTTVAELVVLYFIYKKIGKEIDYDQMRKDW